MAKEELGSSLLKFRGKDIVIDIDVFTKAIAYSGCTFAPMSHFFGAIAAQEIVKTTAKYTPVNQWMYHDVFEALPSDVEEVNREPMNSKYDDIIRIFGREILAKLKKVNTYMVGAGALGCEFIKGWALTGLGCSDSGKVHVCDNDRIEISNRNRQFLFSE